MKVTAGILTWNPVETGRKDLLNRTYASLVDQADETIIFDNGSTDGYNLAGIRFDTLKGFPPGNTCGYGMNKIAASLRDTTDIVVMSNDDMIWHSNAVNILKDIWDDPPDDLKIVSGLVEPTFSFPNMIPWNKPIGIFELAGHKLLSRRSVPGGAWTYQTADHDLIFPVSTFPGVDDVPACHKLTDAGRLVACMPLADHEGIGMSTWGNGSERFQIEPLDVVLKWFD